MVVSECCLDGAQDLADDLLHKARKRKSEEYMLRAKKHILENLSDEDLEVIEQEHWPNIKRLHDERISERKQKYEEQ